MLCTKDSCACVSAHKANEKCFAFLDEGDLMFSIDIAEWYNSTSIAYVINNVSYLQDSVKESISHEHIIHGVWGAVTGNMGQHYVNTHQIL